MFNVNLRESLVSLVVLDIFVKYQDDTVAFFKTHKTQQNSYHSHILFFCSPSNPRLSHHNNGLLFPERDSIVITTMNQDLGYDYFLTVVEEIVDRLQTDIPEDERYQLINEVCPEDLECVISICLKTGIIPFPPDGCFTTSQYHQVRSFLESLILEESCRELGRGPLEGRITDIAFGGEGMVTSQEDEIGELSYLRVCNLVIDLPAEIEHLDRLTSLAITNCRSIPVELSALKRL
jgi:hypothetical protein